MIFLIFILIAVLVMLFATKPRKNLIWLRMTLILVIIALLFLLVIDYINNLTADSAIQ